MENTPRIKLPSTTNDLLVVVDMQNDFVTGPLGTQKAQSIVPGIKTLVGDFNGDVIFTKDTHYDGYLETQEGKNLPVMHCIINSQGWEIVPQLRDKAAAKFQHVCPFGGNPVKDFIDKIKETHRGEITKYAFGSTDLGDIIGRSNYENIYFVGVCTGICVISNAVIAKAADPEARIHVIEDLCACVTPESHEIAINAMRLLQMDIIGNTAQDQADEKIAAPYCDADCEYNVDGRCTEEAIAVDDNARCVSQRPVPEDQVPG